MKLQQFIDSVAVAAHLERGEANRTIGAVLRALRVRLTHAEAARLATWMPPPIDRYLDKSPRAAVKHLSREELVDGVRHELDVDVREALRRIRAVYVVLEHAVAGAAPDELDHLRGLMPQDWREVLEVHRTW